MFRKISVLAMALALAALGAVAPKAEAQTMPGGPGYYFVSICGLYGSATSWCWFGPAAYIGPYTTMAACTADVTLLINSSSPLVTWPYAPSNCFYFN